VSKFHDEFKKKISEQNIMLQSGRKQKNIIEKACGRYFYETTTNIILFLLSMKTTITIKQLM